MRHEQLAQRFKLVQMVGSGPSAGEYEQFGIVEGIDFAKHFIGLDDHILSTHDRSRFHNADGDDFEAAASHDVNRCHSLDNFEAIG